MLQKLLVQTTSSLDKVFLDRPPRGAYSSASMLKNERFSFQVACTTEEGWLPNASRIPFSVESDLIHVISVYRVCHVPSTLPTYQRVDDDYERSLPGLYPDRLEKLDKLEVKLLLGRWQTLWISVAGHESLLAGQYDIKIIFWNDMQNGEKLTETVFTLEVIDALLPEQSLIYTNWFHADCIASLYHCAALSEAHWRHMEAFIAMAANFGMNMILTPCFTPPLDTAVGCERMTVQLVTVRKSGDNYTFGFELLDRWIDLCLSLGIRFFEHVHLFSQWGAEHAPKIEATDDGGSEQIFGWETDAFGPTYRSFIRQYLQALRSHLQAKGVYDLFYFHISDEPQINQIESYGKARQMVRQELNDKQVLEALSHFEFYEHGLVDIPIPVTRTVDDFIGKAPDLWTYYTGFQSFQFSNRLMALASRRNRILGTQLYRCQIKGFLQWAYNFYYTTLSREVCNPYVSTDAFGEFPSGTAYMVYPGPGGPVPSIRLFVFNEGLQDMRAMQLLERKIGHEAVVSLLESVIGPISFKQSPHSDAVFLHMREMVNQKIKHLSQHN